MKKIINWVGNDGLLHILACMVITLCLGYYANPGIALFGGVFAGFCKEILWDGWCKRGTFDLHDLICDLIGAVAGFAVIMPAWAIIQ